MEELACPLPFIPRDGTGRDRDGIFKMGRDCAFTGCMYFIFSKNVQQGRGYRWPLLDPGYPLYLHFNFFYTLTFESLCLFSCWRPHYTYTYNLTSSQVITLVTIIVGSIMFHIYALTYADRPAVRPKTSGPFCLDVDHVPYKTIKDKEIEVWNLVCLDGYGFNRLIIVG